MAALGLALLASAVSWGSWEGGSLRNAEIPKGDVVYGSECEGPEAVGGVDRLVAWLHQKDLQGDSDIAKWLAGSAALLEEDAVLRKYVLNKKKPAPVPPAAFFGLKNTYLQLQQEHAALSRSVPAIWQTLFGEISESRYLDLRAFVGAHAFVLQGAPVLIPFLSPRDTSRYILQRMEGGSVRVVDRVADEPAAATPLLAQLLRYKEAAEGAEDCYTVSLKDRWGEKVPKSDIPQSTCVPSGVDATPDEVVRSIGLGTMSDAKITIGCGDKPTAKEMFACVGTADFEKKVYKKGSVLFKNAVGRIFGDAGKIDKIPSTPLARYAAGQLKIVEKLEQLFSAAIDTVDAEFYKELAELKKAEREAKEKEKKEQQAKKDSEKKSKKKGKKKGKKGKKKKKETEAEAEDES
eukprot:TRINITY_DN18261_c3_g1_i1.p1 TRINITY_DN18261_c3_g1~~TRINITY_DN18261_c3_g1_i1.p1  ORF type:complete len:436 (+),score=204.93 TRINITY_DN18261_c3_g1_i1:91-1308(+)